MSIVGPEGVGYFREGKNRLCRLVPYIHVHVHVVIRYVKKARMIFFFLSSLTLFARVLRGPETEISTLSSPSSLPGRKQSIAAPEPLPWATRSVT